MHKIGDVAFAVVVVAGILVLTRPGSQGPNVIRAIGNGFSGAVTSATGGGAYRKHR